MHRRSYGVHFFYIGENAVLVELMREPTPTASNVSWPNGLRVPTGPLSAAHHRTSRWLRSHPTS